MERAADIACELVQRYLRDALFGRSEAALTETVSSEQLIGAVKLFWTAFADCTLTSLDILFANEDGSRVACYLTANVTQVGPWPFVHTAPTGRPTDMDCTATFQLDADRTIVSFAVTWSWINLTRA
jgi:hypothetical protein